MRSETIAAVVLTAPSLPKITKKIRRFIKSTYINAIEFATGTDDLDITKLVNINDYSMMD
jgi:hypothetical protein